MAAENTKPKDKSRAEREERLAKALRANLRRRKKSGDQTQKSAPAEEGEKQDGDQGKNKA